MNSIVWPDLEFGFPGIDNRFIFRKIDTPVDFQQAENISRCERRFLQGSVLEWLLDSTEVASRIADSNIAFYGIYDERALAGYIVVRAMQENLITEAAFCCVLPEYRECGVAKCLMLGAAIAADHTCARLMFGDAVTVHCKTQQFLDWTVLSQWEYCQISSFLEPGKLASCSP